MTRVVTQPRSNNTAAPYGRGEPRMDVAMSGRLEEVCADPIVDRVLIKNISANGARLISERPWTTDEHVRLAEPGGEQYLDATIIYCERLHDNGYAVGVRFKKDGAASDG